MEEGKKRKERNKGMNRVRSKREEKKGCSINVVNRKEMEENVIKKQEIWINGRIIQCNKLKMRHPRCVRTIIEAYSLYISTYTYSQ